MSIDINEAWEKLTSKVKNCEKCGLCKTRKNTVFGEGSQDSKVVIIGEAPGFDEDEQGRPFVGKAGIKLTEILENGGKIKRASLYIMNVLKCVPPDETKSYKTVRAPNQEEMKQCNEYLEAQLLLLNPQIIVCLGNTPNQWLLKEKEGITKIRGKWRKFRGIDALSMYHPSYIIRNENTENEKKIKGETWADVLSLKRRIEELKLFDLLLKE